MPIDDKKATPNQQESDRFLRLIFTQRTTDCNHGCGLYPFELEKSFEQYFPRPFPYFLLFSPTCDRKASFKIM